MRNIQKILLRLTISLLAVSVLPACSGSESTHLQMMPMEQMSAEVQSSPMNIQQAYQFAAANPDILQKITCYCGCDSLGHESNYDCYVSNVDEYGNITFEEHGLACTTCVDITQDVMRLLRSGKSITEARMYIDSTYGKYIATPAS